MCRFVYGAGYSFIIAVAAARPNQVQKVDGVVWALARVDG